ncbi:MAG: hypothetical protein HY084_12755 [Gemmatimonadetes bacterium]|nr:hypothetical protein [Gemmatimonadota bacterium]
MTVPHSLASRWLARSLPRLLGAPALAVCVALLSAKAVGAQSHPADQVQASVVPAWHSVYDWLQQQRVFGRLPAYEGEERPMSRGTILQHLRTLQRDSMRLSGADRALLRDFVNEFDFKRLESNGLFRKALVEDIPQGAIDGLRERRDPYVYAGHLGDSTISAALWVRKGWGEAWSGGAGRNDYAYLWTKGVRAFVNSTSGFGFHAELDNATANDAFIYRLDPRLASYEAFLSDSANPPTPYETWVSYQRPKLFIAMGKGSASFGPAVTDPVVLRDGAPSMGQFRITFGPPVLHLTFMHGQLGGDTQTDTSWINGRQVVTTSPVPRWVALTRVTWNPSPKFSATLHQMTLYSRRGIDFEYLNPLLPSLFGGLDKGSADNGFLGLDLVGRPIAGTELKGSWLVDDAAGLTFKPFGTGWAKIASTVGAEQRLPYDVRLGVSYSRVDAYVYSNQNGSDAWEMYGVPMGAALGPNSDEVAVRLTRWFPWRTRVMIGTRHVRKGLNPIDANGNVIRDVGGDITTTTDTYGPFLAGSDLQTYRHDEVELESEPIRGLRMTARMNSIVVIGGTRTPGMHSWMLRWSYGF